MRTRTILALSLLAILAVGVLGPATNVFAHSRDDSAQSPLKTLKHGSSDDRADKDDERGKAAHDEHNGKEAQDDRGEHRRGRDTDREAERKLRVTAAGNVATITSKVEAAERESEVFLQMRTARAVELVLRVKIETKTANEEREERLAVGVGFLALVEFTDANANGIFDTNDTVVQRLDLQRLTFTHPTATPVNATQGGKGFRLATHSTGPFRFGVTTDMFPDAALVNGTRFGPTATKVTIILDGFPYRANNTLLALQIRAHSTMKSEVETADTKTEVRMRSDTAEGFFTWEPTLLADGVTKPVAPSITRDQGGALINLVYPHAKRLVHDPLLGIDLRLGAMTLLTGAGTGLILGAFALATLLIALRRFTR